MGRLLVVLLLIVSFCLGAAVSFYNWTSVTFHYLAGQAELPLIALLLGAFLGGIVVMWLLTLARMFLQSREVRRQQRQIRELEAELKSLRALPLASPAAPSTTPEKNA